METQNKYGVDMKLLTSYISGNVSDTEKIQVEGWLNLSDKNKNLFQETEKLWRLSEGAVTADIDIEKAWSKVREKSPFLKTYKTRRLISTTSSYALRIVAVLVIGVFAWYMYRHTGTNISARAGNDLVNLTLSDGSQVTLNKESKLKYPKTFKGEFREVFLEGEAFFNIEKNPERPFIINTENAKIEVLGTSFNVLTDSNGNVEVIVNSGIVSFRGNNTKEMVILKKDDKGIFLKASNKIEKIANSDINYLSWKTRKFDFRRTNLGEVFEKFRKIYGIKILVKNPELETKCKLVGAYGNLSADEIMKNVAQTMSLKLTKADDTYIIEGNECKNKQ
jgi:transmembrane sensor